VIAEHVERALDPQGLDLVPTFERLPLGDSEPICLTLDQRVGVTSQSAARFLSSIRQFRDVDSTSRSPGFKRGWITRAQTFGS
jgi:hypothetical protein